jgi:sugar phosphate permease
VLPAYTFFLPSGLIAERVNLRYFLLMGMILSGIFTILFGLAKITQTRGIAYFVIVQVRGERPKKLPREPMES